MCAGLDHSFAECCIETHIDPVYSVPPAASPNSEFTLSLSLPPPSLCDQQMVASRATQTPLRSRHLDSLELEIGLPDAPGGADIVGGLTVGAAMCAATNGSANANGQSALHASITQSPHSNSTETPVPSSSRSAAGDALTPSMSASSFSAASPLPAAALTAARSPHAHRSTAHAHQAHTLQHPLRRTGLTIARAPDSERSPLASSSSQPQQLGLFAGASRGQRPPARTLSEHANSRLERQQQQQQHQLQQNTSLRVPLTHVLY